MGSNKCQKRKHENEEHISDLKEKKQKSVSSSRSSPKQHSEKNEEDHGQWSGKLLFTDDTRQNKFFKLMGGGNSNNRNKNIAEDRRPVKEESYQKTGGSNIDKNICGSLNSAMTVDKAESLNRKLSHQYEDAHRQRFHKPRGTGLGFDDIHCNPSTEQAPKDILTFTCFKKAGEKSEEDHSSSKDEDHSSSKDEDHISSKDEDHPSDIHKSDRDVSYTNRTDIGRSGRDQSDRKRSSNARSDNNRSDNNRSDSDQSYKNRSHKDRSERHKKDKDKRK